MELKPYHAPEEETFEIQITGEPRLAMKRENGNKIEFYKFRNKRTVRISKKDTRKLKS